MTDDEQGRLQEYGVDAGAPPVDDETEPQCERCGDVLDDDECGNRVALSRGEHQTDVVDLYRGRPERDLCGDCMKLEKYLRGRYNELTDNTSVSGAVAVFCSCQDKGEVDVQPVRAAEPIGDRVCSRCGSAEVVIEELPPKAPGEVGQ